MNSHSNQWRELIQENGLEVSDEQFSKLNQYTELVLEWNTRMNLVSRKDEKNFWPSHIIHSLSVFFSVSFPSSIKIADVGSGGGLPAIPMAILSPGNQFTMFESIRKKCMALENMTGRLSMRNTKIVNSRVEDAAISPAFHATFDAVTARAVAPLANLIRWTRPLVKKSPGSGGAKVMVSKEILTLPLLFALKGGDVNEEIEEAQELSGKIFSYEMSFRGIEKTSLSGKKIVIATYKN